MVTIEKVQDVSSVADDTSMAGTKSRFWAVVEGLGFRRSKLLLGLVCAGSIAVLLQKLASSVVLPEHCLHTP